MSILNDIVQGVRSLYRLLFPHICPVCRGVVEGEGQYICTQCWADAPLTGYEHLAENPVATRIWNIVPIERACSLLFYVHEGRWRNLAYNFKFRGLWRDAITAGRMMGDALEQSPLWGHIEAVVAIPLHSTRTLSREYNQSEYLAQGIAERLNIPHLQGVVRRTVNNRPQRQTPTKEERWDNVEGIFSVEKPERLQGRHILLVDDVFTTGATIISCCEAILRAVPDCHISVATLFASKQEVGIKD